MSGDIPTKMYIELRGITKHGSIRNKDTIINAIHNHLPDVRILDVPDGYSVINPKTNLVCTKDVLVEFKSKMAVKQYCKSIGFKSPYGYLSYGDAKDAIRHAPMYCKPYELEG